MPLEIKGLEGLIERLDGMANPATIENAITRATLLVEREAKKKAPKGTIAGSITSTIDGTQGIVYTPVEFAPYVELGTGKFSIHPQGGRKELPWVYVEGSTVKSSKKTIYTDQSARQMVAAMREDGLDAHMTYGQHPQPFMRPAIDENRDRIVEILREGLIK